MEPNESVQGLFAAGTDATATVAFSEQHARRSGSIAVRLETTGFSGTINYQGRPSADAAWTNSFYVTMADGALNPSNDELSFTTQTANTDYAILNPMPFMQVVMTRTAGSIEGYARFYEHGLGIAVRGTATTQVVDTELPAAAALADAAANPTTPLVGAAALGFNGTTFDRLRTAGTGILRTASAGATDTIYDGATAVTPVMAAISGATSGDNTLVAANATKKIRVFALSIVAAGAVAVRFESAAAGTALTGVMSFAANGGYVLPYNPLGWFETAANQLLNMELGGAVQVSGHLTYGLI